MRDRASKFIDAFDEIFRTERMKILKTPVRTPVANAFADRWIGTLRRELLDRTIIWNRRQLNNLVVDYIDHDNTHRPHRSLDQRPPVATDPSDQPKCRLTTLILVGPRGRAGLTLATTVPFGCLHCDLSARRGRGARTDRSGGRDLIGALS